MTQGAKELTKLVVVVVVALAAAVLEVVNVAFSKGAYNGSTFQDIRGFSWTQPTS
jgi:hypothetical protein